MLACSGDPEMKLASKQPPSKYHISACLFYLTAHLYDFKRYYRSRHISTALSIDSRTPLLLHQFSAISKFLVI